MITRFYKIVDNCGSPIYIGVTTRTIEKRFKEHIEEKSLNPELYHIEEIDKIIHSRINTIQQFKFERKRVKELEVKYIAEYRQNYTLLNKSAGGEWGSQILNRLLSKINSKNKFTKEEITFLQHIKFRRWIKNWIIHRQNPTKIFLQNWIYNRHKVKSWLIRWIIPKNTSKTKSWLSHWISHRSENKTKLFMVSWINHRSENKFRVWLSNWIRVRLRSRTKTLLLNWIINKTTINNKMT